MADGVPCALILAAGRGRRLGPLGDTRPKCLLSFGGRTLLERHVSTLRALGVEEIRVVVGYRRRDVASELARLPGRAVELLENPAFERGSLWSLARGCASLRGGGDVLLMDADVLCSPAVLAPLVRTPGTGLLVDRGCDLHDLEAVKVAVRDGRVVDFAKRLDPGIRFDYVGESVGFFRIEARAADRLADEVERRVRASRADESRLDEPYEHALSTLLRGEAERCRVHDVTGLPWIEIDFPEDLERARYEILPRLPLAQPGAAPLAGGRACP